MSKRILFLTDSLPLPRGKGDEFVSYEETYLAKLRTKYPDHTIINASIGGGTIRDLYIQVFYYKFFNPDIVFLQSGIVDCAPRAFKEKEQKILTKLNLRPKKLIKFLRKNRGYKLTKPGKFDFWCKRINNDFNPITVYAIGILPASEEYELKVPGITKSIQHYNSILADNFKFIETTNFPFDGILSDHHHLNARGHELIYNKLVQIIDN